MIITLCSTNPVWENKSENINRINALFNNLPHKSDLVVLPEMFSTGFTMNTSLAENEKGASLKCLIENAQKHNCAVLASIPICELELPKKYKYYNRAFFVFPDGSYKTYDKRHLFSMVREPQNYTAGNKKSIIEYKGVKFAINICYDIRFPVWSKNIDNEYDVLLNIANFPSPRANVIDPLCKARAIENIAFMGFVNRTGEDPTSTYPLSSHFIDYKGFEIGEEGFVECDGIETPYIKAKIDLDGLNSFRTKFPAWKDADKFKIKTVTKKDTIIAILLIVALLAIAFVPYFLNLYGLNVAIITLIAMIIAGAGAEYTSKILHLYKMKEK